MGMFDFFTKAGDRPEDELTKTVEVTPERLDQLRRESIAKKIAALDIEGEQVKVAVKGEVATLTGRAPTQEALEKIVLCAGNQFGIGSVDCQLEVDRPAASGGSPGTAASGETTPSSFYTVQSGDTLSGIAKAQYGDAGKYMKIFEANQPMLTDPDRIYPGQSLRIPPL